MSGSRKKIAGRPLLDFVYSMPALAESAVTETCAQFCHGYSQRRVPAGISSAVVCVLNCQQRWNADTSWAPD